MFEELKRCLQEPTILKDLISFAEMCIRNKYRNSVSGHEKCLYTGSDILSMAIDRILLGKRIWKKEKQNDFVIFLKNQIYSITGNLFTKADEKAFLFNQIDFETGFFTIELEETEHSHIEDQRELTEA